jgi:hypothetical protein
MASRGLETRAALLHADDEQRVREYVERLIRKRGARP